MPGQYSTESLENQPELQCAKRVLSYGKWFKFQATTPFLEINLNLGGKKGSMHFPYVSVWDEQMNLVDCKAYEDEFTPLTLINTELKPGGWYYICVNNHQHSSYVGSFTLCVNDVPSYDFFEGAIELTDVSSWCSPEGAFSTIGASADKKKSSCMSSDGPNFNRWFKFQATSNRITVEVKAADKHFDFPYLGLFDSELRSLACAQYKDDNTPISVTSTRLVEGRWYYISVDHKYNIKYRGAFTLCLDDGRAQQLRSKLVQVSGRLFYLDSRPAQGNIELLTDKGVTVHQASTDSKGKFMFENLSARETFMLKVDAEDPAAVLSAYQTDEQGAVLRRAVPESPNLYKFEAPNQALNHVMLVSPSEFDIDVAEGTRGLIGKVVERKSPTDGVANVAVNVYDTGRRKMQSTTTDATGRFQFLNLPADQSVLVKLDAPQPDQLVEMLILNDKEQPVEAANSSDMDAAGYFHFRKLPPIAVEMQTVDAQDVALQLLTDFSNLSEGRQVTLRNIYFEPGKYTLLDKSYTELAELAGVLKQHASMRIEIGGHTDNTGEEESNKALSEARAQVVANYLVQSGVERSRLSFVGYGSSKPLQSNATAAGRQANRRVEFTVISK